MRLPFFIARRYLFAKKSYNIINTISLISAVGIAIGTMALVVVLSVYNGFEGLVSAMYSQHAPDMIIVPAKGKSFSPWSDQDAETFKYIKGSPLIKSFCEVVEENVFLRYGEKETVAIIKGVDSSFVEASKIAKTLISGEFRFSKGDEKYAVVGRTLAFNIGVRVEFLTPIKLYFPTRSEEISLVNPQSSLNEEVLFPAGIYAMDNDYDSKYLFTDIEMARELLEYTEEVTSIELYFSSLALSSDNSRLEQDFAKRLGDRFILKNRYKQNEDLYKMMETEKIAIYLILLFIIIIISCNLIAGLAMLIIEKKEDIGILYSLGAREKGIKIIFLLDGWLISLLGLGLGVVIGLIICVIQQQFGVVSMPGNFIINSYPVIIKISDIFAIIAGVSITGFIASLIPVASSRFV